MTARRAMMAHLEDLCELVQTFTSDEYLALGSTLETHTDTPRLLAEHLKLLGMLLDGAIYQFEHGRLDAEPFQQVIQALASIEHIGSIAAKRLAYYSKLADELSDTGHEVID